MSDYSIVEDHSNKHWPFVVMSDGKEATRFPTRLQAQKRIDYLEELRSPYGEWKSNLFFNESFGKEAAQEILDENPEFAERYRQELAPRIAANTRSISDSFERPERERVFANEVRVRSCKNFLLGLPGTIVGDPHIIGGEKLWLVNMDFDRIRGKTTTAWHSDEEMVMEDEAAPRHRLPKELHWDGKFPIGDTLTQEESGEIGTYRVTEHFYIDATASSFLDEVNDTDMPVGWYSNSVLVEQHKKGQEN